MHGKKQRKVPTYPKTSPGAGNCYFIKRARSRRVALSHMLGQKMAEYLADRVMNIQHESDLVNITDTINNDQRQQTLRVRNMNNEPAPEPITATAEGQGSNSI